MCRHNIKVLGLCHHDWVTETTSTHVAAAVTSLQIGRGSVVTGTGSTSQGEIITFTNFQSYVPQSPKTQSHY